MVALSTNSVEVYNIPAPTKDKDGPPEASRLYSLDLPGHRSDIRTLCLSSDDQLLASASNGKTEYSKHKFFLINCLQKVRSKYGI